MKLLVSVRNAAEARAALEGGADVIDAKDPVSGALGAVSMPEFEAIRAAVGPRVPVTAAIGDASHEDDIARAARTFTAAGAALVKVGFAGITSGARVASLLAAAVHGARAGRRPGRVVAVAYADCGGSRGHGIDGTVECAARAGAYGILVDTADKRGAGLRGLMPGSVLADWVRRAHDAGLLVAVAGRLTADDLPWARQAGADIAGVRGAACGGHRTGIVSARAVCELGARCRESRNKAIEPPVRRSSDLPDRRERLHTLP